MIQFELNSVDNSETGIIPFEAHFGSEDAIFFEWPPTVENATTEYLQRLNDNLATLRDVTKTYQEQLIAGRTADNAPDVFPKTSLVLRANRQRRNKLESSYSGPYEVLDHTGNRVQLRHIVENKEVVCHPSELKFYKGKIDADAERLARSDNHQHEVAAVLAYRGDPSKRTTMEFQVKFADGDIVWLPLSNDLIPNVSLRSFIEADPALHVLLRTAAQATEWIRDLNKTPITEVEPGMTFFLDIRSFGGNWYKVLTLPELFTKVYVLECVYVCWEGATRKRAADHTKISLRSNLLKQTYVFDHYSVYCYGTVVKFDPDRMVLVDQQFLKSYKVF